MKKVILSLFVLALTISANAQFYVQGTLGLTTQSAKYDDGYEKDTQTTTAFVVSPGLGYRFNSNFALGMDLGYASSKVTGIDAVTTLAISPYARCFFADVKDILEFYLDGVYEHAVLSQDKEDMTTNTLALRPGMSIKLSEKCSLTAQMFLFSYVMSDDDINATSFSINPTNVSLGIRYSF